MITKLFSTQIHHEPLRGLSAKEREAIVRMTQHYEREDRLGFHWSQENYPHGFTSYGSITDLHLRSPEFTFLESKLSKAVWEFVKKILWEGSAPHLEMRDLWFNRMEKGASHSWHLHPQSVISGTYYVKVPKDSPPLRFEDPRLGLFMGSPARRGTWFEVHPKAGDLVLFESWLRHEVPRSSAKGSRISLSFNYQLSNR